MWLTSKSRPLHRRTPATSRHRLSARRQLVIVLGALAVAAGVIAASGLGQPSSRWRVVFGDDFSQGLDQTKWGLYSGQPGGDPGGWWAPSHVVVKDGILRLQSYRDPRFRNRWVSGGLSSARALRQTYGRYEVRFRMEPGHGIAGILLLWPARGGWPPEIDFAEDSGTHSTRSSMSATLHYGAANRQIARTVSADFTRWHTMAVEWTPAKLVYKLDDRIWGTLKSPRVPAVPMEFDMQTQAGTCGDPHAPCPDASTPAHVELQVDWVRAYAHR
jgi:beta-glucanase (GH16 family)